MCLFVCPVLCGVCPFLCLFVYPSARSLENDSLPSGTTPTVYRHETERIQTAFVPSACLHPIGVPKGRPFETRVRFYEPE